MHIGRAANSLGRRRFFHPYPAPQFEREPVQIGADETMITVNSAESGGAAIPKVLEILAARSDLDLDRLGDVQLVGDFLSDWTSRLAIDSRPLEIGVSELTNSIEIRIGPLEPGLGKKMLKRAELPGYGNTLESSVDRAEVMGQQTGDGQADFLVLEIATQAS